MRRFTRLTNGFSKKIEMHAFSVAIHFMHYNFSRIHQTLRVTPAMEAGLASALFWSSLAVALLLAGLVAFPVNRWLIQRGRGHAVVHAHHAH